MFGFFYSLYTGLSKLGSLFKEGMDRTEGIRDNADYDIGIYTDPHGNRRWIRGNDLVGYTKDLNGDDWYTNARTCKLVYNISAAKRKALDSDFRTVISGPKWVSFEEEQRIDRGEIPRGQKYYDKKTSQVYVERAFSDYYCREYYHLKNFHFGDVDMTHFEGYMDTKTGYVVRPTDHYMFLNKLWMDNGRVYDTEDDLKAKVIAANRFLDTLRDTINKSSHNHYYDENGVRKGNSSYWSDYWHWSGKIDRVNDKFEIGEFLVNSRPMRPEVKEKYGK